VCPQAGKWLRDTSTQTQNRPPPEIAPIKTLNVGLRSLSPSNHAPAQGFPKVTMSWPHLSATSTRSLLINESFCD
jgi:hypothetical protein